MVIRPILLLFFLTAPAFAEVPKVVATITPLHSLTAAIMEGVGAPELLVPASVSAHTFQFKPSDMRKLREADIVFSIGPSYEIFLQPVLKNLPAHTTSVSMQTQEGIDLLPVRTPTGFAPDDGKPSSIDGHIWLKPYHAMIMMQSIADALCAKDSTNCHRYYTNAHVTEGKLIELNEALKKQLPPLANKSFIVFHDAYQYLEQTYGVHSIATITLHPETPPGAKHIAQIRQLIRTHPVVCAFYEPQFPTKWIRTLTEGTSVHTAELDALGVGLTPGPDLYIQMMRRLTGQLVKCLSK